MRIEMLTDDNPLYVLPFFDEFFRHYASEFEIVRVSLCRPMGKRSRRELLRSLCTLYGPIGFVRLSASILVARALGVLPIRRGSSHAHTIAQLCRAYGVPFGSIGNPNEPEFIDAVAQRTADVIVSVACPYILKDRLLNLPAMGCINIHSARLPQYKGMMPTFWQMLHGEKELGITVHYMSRGVDEGGILLQESIWLKPGESMHQVIRRSKRHGAHAMAQVLRRIAAGEAPGPVVPAGESSYYTFPSLKDIRAFRSRGLRAI